MSFSDDTTTPAHALPIGQDMESPSPATETLAQGAALAERVLLKVEELELLVATDRPRRLVDMAQAELAAAVADADNFWAGREGDFAAEAALSADAQREWQAFRSLLAHSARRAAQASATIAARLAVCEDALAALGLHREYDQAGGLRSRPLLPDPSTVMA